MYILLIKDTDEELMLYMCTSKYNNLFLIYYNFSCIFVFFFVDCDLTIIDSARLNKKRII